MKPYDSWYAMMEVLFERLAAQGFCKYCMSPYACRLTVCFPFSLEILYREGDYMCCTPVVVVLSLVLGIGVKLR
jgi:hypothetical protein